MVPIAIANIRHSLSPKSVNIYSHIKSLFASVPTTLYNMTNFQHKKVQVIRKGKEKKSLNR